MNYEERSMEYALFLIMNDIFRKDNTHSVYSEEEHKEIIQEMKDRGVYDSYYEQATNDLRIVGVDLTDTLHVNDYMICWYMVDKEVYNELI